jgi:hypothetical protein
LPIEVIAALLNGPVANAYLSTHRTSRDNKIEVMKHIPIPRLSPSQIRLIVSLVREYMSYREKQHTWFEQAIYFERRCRGIIGQIDGEILTAYNLPFHLEQNLLAKVNVGARQAEELIFEDFKLAREPKLYDELV